MNKFQNQSTNIGKHIYEGHFIDKNYSYNPLTKMFEKKSLLEDYILSKTYTELKYLIGYYSYHMSLKFDEWLFLYDKLYTSKNIKDVTDKVYELQTDSILYHITPLKNENHIKKNGMIPRNSHTYLDNYPDRVYFFWPTERQSLKKHVANHIYKFKEQKKKYLDESIERYKKKEISYKTFKYICDNRYDYRDWLFLKINLKSRLLYNQNDLSTQYRFFDDPRSVGIFTYENIDPVCIDIDEKYHYDKDIDDFEYVLDYLQ